VSQLVDDGNLLDTRHGGGGALHPSRSHRLSASQLLKKNDGSKLRVLMTMK
jgi:hypothetical protein